MKTNQKLLKRALLVASFATGVIGANSVFNEAQAYISQWNPHSPVRMTCVDNNGNTQAIGTICVSSPVGSCQSNGCPLF